MKTDELAVVSVAAFYLEEEQSRLDHCVVNQLERPPLIFKAASYEGIVWMRLGTRREGIEIITIICPCLLLATVSVNCPALTYSSSMQAFHLRSSPFSAFMSSSVSLKL